MNWLMFLIILFVSCVIIPLLVLGLKLLFGETEFGFVPWRWMLRDVQWRINHRPRKHRKQMPNPSKKTPRPAAPNGKPLNYDAFFDRVSQERTPSQKSEDNHHTNLHKKVKTTTTPFFTKK